MGLWFTAWIYSQFSATFDTGLSDIIFVDIMSIRFGLPAFSAEQACARSPQMVDIYAHPTVICSMEGGNVRLYNQIRDIFSIIYQMRRLELVLNRRVFCQWSRGVARLMSYLCRLLDEDNSNGLCIPIYLWTSRLFLLSRLGSFRLLPKKLRELPILISKPNIFEMLGGLEVEAIRLCESLCQAADRKRWQIMNSSNFGIYSFMIDILHFD